MAVLDLQCRNLDISMKGEVMKLFIVFDPEQQEAVFVHPDVREFKKFIKELRDELYESGVEDALDCPNYEVLEMYGNWIGTIYDADWLKEGSW